MGKVLIREEFGEMDSCSDYDWIEGSHPFHPTLYLSKRIPGRTTLSLGIPTERDSVPSISCLICLALFSATLYNRVSISKGDDKQ
jgi:hypothetical protein